MTRIFSKLCVGETTVKLSLWRTCVFGSIFRAFKINEISIILIFRYMCLTEIVAALQPEHDFYIFLSKIDVSNILFFDVFKIDDTSNEILTFFMFRWWVSVAGSSLFLLR